MMLQSFQTKVFVPYFRALADQVERLGMTVDFFFLAFFKLFFLFKSYFFPSRFQPDIYLRAHKYTSKGQRENEVTYSDW